MDVAGKHALVVGLARSGFAVARALARRGATVTVTDRKPPAEFSELLPELLRDKVGLELGSQREETFLRHQLIVVSPGVPWDLPQLQAARDRGIPVYPEVEAASWFLQGTLVGITGSNGKTTTTSLLGDMLKASGFNTFVGGNIGNALSTAVDQSQPGTKFVTELSSFQLEGIQEFRPHVAVMLNLSPNHLDRHPSLEAYANAKRQIFRNQGGQDYAVLNADDAWVAGLREDVPSRPVLFSRRHELANGVFVSEGRVYYRVRHMERTLFETGDVSLRGDFNLEDVLAATTAACVLGADFAAIRKAVREFQAVEHRLEYVGKIRGVEFYNNSKATSVDATLKSLEAFDQGVHLIMGGKDKGALYTPLLPLIKGRVREVLLIGAATPIIAQQLAGSTKLVDAGDLSTAVLEAFAHARPGEVVLLAPACSSFDQFKDYEERGRVFKSLVKMLAKDVAAGLVRDGGYGTRESRPTRAESLPPGPALEPVAASPSTPPVPEPRAETLPEPPMAIAVEAVLSLPQPLEAAPAEPPAPPVEPASAAELPPAEAAVATVALDADTAEVEPGPLETAEPELAAPAALPPVEEAPPPPQPLTEEPAQPAEEVPAPPPPLIEESPEAVKVAPEEMPPPPAAPVVEPEPEAKAEPRLPPPIEGAVIALPASSNGFRHMKLSYLYEVDAVETPGVELQLVPPEEPLVHISAGKPKAVTDDLLPYEVRPAARKKPAARPPAPEVKTKPRSRKPKSELKAGSGGKGPASADTSKSAGPEGSASAASSPAEPKLPDDTKH